MASPSPRRHAGGTQEFRRLCRCLRGEAAGLPDTDDGWMDLLALANEHLVTPALWLRLRSGRQAVEVPADVAGYLSALHDVNAARNRRIADLATEAARHLNAAGLVPAVLKGGAFLFDGRRPVGWRILSDLDLLVRPERFGAARRALARAGWTQMDEDGAGGPHAVTLHRPGAVVTLDLHWAAGPQTAVLSPEALLADASVVEVDGARLALPSPTHRALHNFLNTQVFATNHDAGAVALRQVLDLAALARSHDGAPDVDWPALAAIARTRGLSRRLHCWLHLAHETLRAWSPPEHRSGVAARLHLWRSFAQMDRPWLAVPGRLTAGAVQPFGRWRLQFLYPRTPAPLLGLHHARTLWHRHGLAIVSRLGRQGDVR